MLAVPSSPSTEDQTWSDLMQAFERRIAAHACKDVVDGFKQLRFGSSVEPVARVNDRLRELVGWTLSPVDGLLAKQQFFELLSAKRYPYAIHLRGPGELDFARSPDIFHDLVGHLPLLLNADYRAFLLECARLSKLYPDQGTEILGRIFWFTAETGLVREDGVLKVLGAAILTSSQELEHALAGNAERLAFDLDAVARQSYSHREVQRQYYVMRSVADFKPITEALAPLMARLAGDTPR